MPEQKSDHTLSGDFESAVAVGGGEAVDARGSQGMLYKPSGSVEIDKRLQILLPARTLWAAALILAIIALGYWYFQQPSKMAGDFNIVVAEVGEVTAEGTVSSAIASQLSRQLFDFLDSEYKNTDFGLEVQVAHRNIGIIIEDREAERLARRLNADLVIYGSIFMLGDEARMTPKFYVAEHPDTSELTGQHELGIPIDFALNSLDFQEEVNRELQARSAILVDFTKGMIHLSSRNPEVAETAFQRAARVADTYADFQGKEVLYLFISSAQQKMGDFKAANAALDEALRLNSEYARAYISRGNILYMQAQMGELDTGKLEAALEEYQHAAQALDQPPGTYVTAKTDVSIGNVYVVLAQVRDDSTFFDMAEEHYESVIEQYERTEDAGLRNLAAAAYHGMGIAYERQQMLYRAEAAYQRRAALTNGPSLKDRIWAFLEAIGVPVPDKPVAIVNVKVPRTVEPRLVTVVMTAETTVNLTPTLTPSVWPTATPTPTPSLTPTPTLTPTLIIPPLVPPYPDLTPTNETTIPQR